MVRAIFDRIYHDIRQRIERGDFTFQDYLPPESTLVQTYDCSHNTIRRALALLAKEGYVQAQHGKGVRVLYRPHKRALFELGGIETFQEAAERNQLSTTTTVAKMQETTVTEAIAEQTGFSLETELIYIERVRCLNGKPVILDKNYYRSDLVPGLTAEIAEQSIYRYIEETLSMRITTSKRTITVERTNELDRELLDIAGIDYLAVVDGQTFNITGEMFEFTESRHHPDYFCFHETAQRALPIRAQ